VKVKNMKTWINAEINVLFRGQVVVYLYHDKEDSTLRNILIANEFVLRDVVSKCEGILDYTVAFRHCTKKNSLFLNDDDCKFRRILDEHYIEYCWWRCCY